MKKHNFSIENDAIYIQKSFNYILEFQKVYKNSLHIYIYIYIYDIHWTLSVWPPVDALCFIYNFIHLLDKYYFKSGDRSRDWCKAKILAKFKEMCKQCYCKGSLCINYIYSIILAWNIIEKPYLATWGLETDLLVSVNRLASL